MQDDARLADSKMATPAECRRRGARLRDRAMTIKDPDARSEVVQAAEQWESLAAEIESVLGLKTS